MMKRHTSLLALAACLAFGGESAEASSPKQACPVIIKQVDLSYKHAGGRSVPQLRMSFGNRANRPISTVTFTLSLLDSDGYLHPYPEDLQHSEGLEPGIKTVFTWELASEAVDIHRTGETVAVEKVEFADTSSWVDDGSQSCAFTVDYRAK